MERLLEWFPRPAEPALAPAKAGMLRSLRRASLALSAPGTCFPQQRQRGTACPSVPRCSVGGVSPLTQSTWAGDEGPEEGSEKQATKWVSTTPYTNPFPLPPAHRPTGQRDCHLAFTLPPETLTPFSTFGSTGRGRFEQPKHRSQGLQGGYYGSCWVL